MQRLSRRQLAHYVAEQLKGGVATKTLVGQIVSYLHEERQLDQVELLIRDIEQISEKQYGVVTASLTTARPVDAETKRHLEAFIKEMTSAKQVVVADERVEEDLIGGVIIHTPSSTFDGSVRTQLKQLAAATKG